MLQHIKKAGQTEETFMPITCKYLKGIEHTDSPIEVNFDLPLQTEFRKTVL